MKNISFELMLLTNLSNSAHWHKDHCNAEDCNTSLFQLKEAARYLQANVWSDEKEEAIKLVDEMPI